MINRTILFLLAMLLACGLSEPLEAANFSWTGDAGTTGWYDTLFVAPHIYVNNFGMVGESPAFPGETDDVALGGYTIETNGAARVHNISLIGDLRIAPLHPLIVYSAITNNGIIHINDTVSGQMANLIIHDHVSLGGTGQISVFRRAGRR